MMYNMHQMRSGKLFVNYLLQIIIFSACLFTQANAQNAINCQKKQCIAVVDAGSSGTRLHVYAYKVNERKGSVQISALFEQKINPGISSLENQQALVDQYLDALFTEKTDESIPVFFYATAGMRMVKPQAQEALYDKISSWFARQSDWRLLDIRTIKGQEEGVFDWLAVHYDRRLLGKYYYLAGVMDMGGASVQVVFPLKQQPDSNDPNVVSLHFKKHTYYLYSKSFLGLGLNEIVRQYMDKPDCYPQAYPLPDEGLGDGNSMNCRAKVGSLINGVHQVRDQLGTIITDNKVKSWYALGVLSYLAADPLFQFKNKTFNMQKLNHLATNKVCQKSWDELQMQYPDNPNIDLYCFEAAYYSSLLLDGYGMKPNQPITYNLSDWTKGVVVKYALNKEE